MDNKKFSFGSDDWFVRLGERISFPKKIAFYYSKSQNYIGSQVIKDNSKVENTKYSNLKFTLPIGPNDLALIDLEEIHSPKEYHDKLVKLSELWDVEM